VQLLEIGALAAGRAWWDGSGAVLAAADPEAVFGRLAANCSFDVVQAQSGAWSVQIAQLQALGAELPEAHVFLEFAIPRMGRRADAVIVAGGLVFVVEYKVGSADFARHALLQVQGYGLDLAHFHETSRHLPIVPILVATQAPLQGTGLGLWKGEGVHPPVCAAPADLGLVIRQFVAAASAPAIDALAWAEGAYRPTPTIIEAAQALFRGHDVTEIARSGAGAENLTQTTVAIDRVIARCQAQGEKAILFVTGVPGAGKTLAGLNIACSRMDAESQAPATFLSGNGPLVEVLREALVRDRRRRHREPVPGDPDLRYLANREPDAFVQNVHKFRDDQIRNAKPPAEHVVIFDEAQRAWTANETRRFMTTKRGMAEWTQSEPQFLLSVMDRHPDWCTVICLVGEGQEINRGEAGIGAWVEALAQGPLSKWQVHASPHLMDRGARLPAQLRAYLAHRAAPGDADLHLAVSVRSFRARQLSAFVGALLEDNPHAAAAILPDAGEYPLVRTRSLADARRWLRDRRAGGERAGLVASSNALRLKPEGLFLKSKVDVCSWFLNGREDVRSSDMLEDAASEFDVQGLELDWTGVAWDLNLMRGPDGWLPRRFRGTAWEAVNEADKRAYVLNSYRVLLTRARQGMVIFVPPGDRDDPTRPPADYDAVDAWLSDCGIPELQAANAAAGFRSAKAASAANSV
jgi:hypothetical protein